MEFNPFEIIAQLEKTSELLNLTKVAMEALLSENQELEAEIEALKENHTVSFYGEDGDFNERF